MKFLKDLGLRGINRMRYGIYLCDCGKEFETRVNRVDSGVTKSCGCLRNKLASDRTRKIMTTHGDTGTKLHNKWMAMIYRCYNKSNNSYKNYGAKGVTVCEEWINSYTAFKQWALSNGYEEHLELDKDILCNAKGIYPKIYSPNTCMFIERSLNRRVIGKRTVLLTDSSGCIEFSDANKFNKYRGSVGYKGIRYYSKFTATPEEARLLLLEIIKGIINEDTPPNYQ